MRNRIQKLAKRLAAAAAAFVLVFGIVPAVSAQAAYEYKPTVEKAYEYDNDLGKYIKRAVRESTYDSRGRLRKVVITPASDLSDTVATTKYVYGTNNKLTVKYYEKDGTEPTEYEGKEVYTFSRTTLKRMIAYESDGTIDGKNLYTVDSAGRISKVVHYDYDSETTKYEKEYIVTIKYNKAGKMTQMKLTAFGEVYEVNTLEYNTKGYLKKESITFRGTADFATVTYYKYFNGKPQTMIMEVKEADTKQKMLTTYGKKKQTLYDQINFFYGEHLIMLL